EVQPLHPADSGGKARRGTRRGAAGRRPDSAGLRTGMSGARDRLRRPEKPRQRGRAPAARRPSLHGARRARHAAERRLPDEGDARRHRSADDMTPRLDSADRPVAAWPAAHGSPWIEGQPTLRDVTDDVIRPLLGRPGAGWWWCFGAAATALAIGVAMVTYEVMTGIGTWGLNRTVGW